MKVQSRPIGDESPNVRTSASGPGGWNCVGGTLAKP